MLDQDTRAVTDALDAAQARSGLGKAVFARALGTSPSRYSTYRTGKVAPTAAFLMRATRLADSLATAAERGIPSSLTAAQSIQKALDSEDDLWAFTLVLEARDRLDDTIRHRPTLTSAWEANASIGDKRWNALFAAIVGHTFEDHDLPAPKWTADHALEEDWMPVESLRYDSDQVKERTPSWLAARHIFVADRDMATL